MSLWGTVFTPRSCSHPEPTCLPLPGGRTPATGPAGCRWPVQYHVLPRGGAMRIRIKRPRGPIFPFWDVLRGRLMQPQRKLCLEKKLKTSFGCPLVLLNVTSWLEEFFQNHLAPWAFNLFIQQPNRVINHLLPSILFPFRLPLTVLFIFSAPTHANVWATFISAGSSLAMRAPAQCFCHWKSGLQWSQATGPSQHNCSCLEFHASLNLNQAVILHYQCSGR